ncbi:DNA mismatch endonuclease Vsr [Ramlibacter sp. G-1-2-2]|uniref:Very short patch repair endonuclease n=1 Tax=Ramlibacter agri TaxID=2728837 RepID=A0A848GZ00_9BURK|nr:DNA mismatch endonuclease Vsr [Ramlibacter agri]
MVDTLSISQRSALMRSIRAKDTAPEMRVRQLAHGMGYRYVLHDKRLPGSPDLVFPSRKAVIQVHGCYWHGHECRVGRRPKSNLAYWTPKIDRNVERDVRSAKALRRLGWRVMVVWECQTVPAKLDALQRRIRRFLDRDAM